VNGARALAFIALATLKNVALRQLRRVREPRYLVATLFGMFYIVSIAWRPGGGRIGRPPPALTGDLTVPFRAGALAFLGLLFILAGWIFGGDEAGLGFSEAEIQFLFPAPLPRRQLVHYKLVRTIVLSLASGIILALTMGRGMAARRGYFIVGAWLGVATLSLHLVSASLTRLRLLDEGLGASLRRALSLVVPAAIAASIVGALVRVPLPWPKGWSEVLPYFTQLFHTAPLSWAAMIFAPAANVATARGLGDLWPWLPGAVLVLAVHYAWALSTGAAFEQASLASAEKRSRRRDRLRRGQLTIRANARPPFRLNATGRPAVAIYWKNLTAAVRTLPLRFAVVVILPGVVGGVAALVAGAPFNRELGAIVAALLAASTTFFGVQVYRIDFRFDLANIDVLKSYPVRGAEIALAEVLGPFTVLTLAEWLFLGAAAVLAPAEVLAPAGRLPLALTAMIVLPAVTLPGLLVQNLVAVLFPAWVESGATQPRGVEAIGQRLLTLLGTLLAVGLMLVPATALGAIAGALLHRVIGFAALPVAALVAAGVVAVEAGLGLVALGRAFERFDPARI
jgi:hypothetical protein